MRSDPRCAVCPARHRTVPNRVRLRLRDHHHQGQPGHDLQRSPSDRLPSGALPRDLHKDHGRFEWRRCAVVDLSGDPRGRKAPQAALHGCRPAGRRCTSGKCAIPASAAPKGSGAGLPSTPDAPGPGHGRLRCTRIGRLRTGSMRWDCTWDEDRCRVQVRNLPRNLAGPIHAADARARRDDRFRHHLPGPHRRYAARAQEAFDAILTLPEPGTAGDGTRQQETASSNGAAQHPARASGIPRRIGLHDPVRDPGDPRLRRISHGFAPLRLCSPETPALPSRAECS